MSDNKNMETARIIFDDFISLNDLLKEYNAAELSVVDINIGYDDKIYILLSSNVPPRIEGMLGTFVNPIADAKYYVYEISVDWESGAFIYSIYNGLGRYKPNFHIIQPLKDDKLLLLGTRTFYRSGFGGEKNAFIMDRYGGGVCDSFCFGDGIKDCIALSDGKIITSYFDEGIFGNYGWDDPIGKNGVIVWSETGEIIWQADHDMCDCYAINTDENENLWFYYYDDFDLVKTDFKSEKMYTPDISGAAAFFLTKDAQHIIFDKGYSNHGKFVYAPITQEKIGDYKPLEFVYQDSKIECLYFKFRSSKVIIVDDQHRIFAKDILSIR